MRSFYLAAGGTLFTFVMTALGAAFVFCFKCGISQRTNRMCLGFAGGVMSAAAVFSLLLPAAEQTRAAGDSAVLVTALGFLFGAGLMAILDALLARSMRGDEGRRRRTLLFSAVTLHNIPEGMAVGLSFALAAEGGTAALAGAGALALGVGVQNDQHSEDADGGPCA